MILKNYNIFKESKIDNIQRPWIHNDDFVVTNESVLNGRLIKEHIPDEVKGSFICSYKKLTSLEGCPTKVGGNADFSSNELVSLEGCPSLVGGDFHCDYNLLTSLKGSPNIINTFFLCEVNELTSLEGCPILINKQIMCANNNVNLLIEKNFIKSGKYTNKETYWIDLLKYMIDKNIDLNKIVSWPKGFLTDDIIKSVKGISKFNL